MKQGSLLAMAIAMTLPVFAQVGQSQGPYVPTNAVVVPVTGSASGWANVIRVISPPPPADFANTIDLATAGDYTDRIVTSGHNFGIPAGATIVGIEAQVVRSNSNGTTQTITDREVYLVKGGVVQDGSGQNQANTVGAWPPTPQPGTYGGPTDLWNNTWTVADINDAGFGVALSAQQTATTGVVQEARVWIIRLRVFYSESLPIRLKSFEVQKTPENHVSVSFVTEQEVNVASFEIQRSMDGQQFETITRIVPETPDSDVERRYSFLDDKALPGLNMYRLKQTDLDGKFEIFPVRYVKLDDLSNKIRFVQTAGGTIRISGINKAGAYNLLIRDTNGRLLQQQKLAVPGANADVNVGIRPGVKGVVIVSLVNETEQRTVRLFIQ